MRSRNDQFYLFKGYTTFFYSFISSKYVILFSRGWSRGLGLEFRGLLVLKVSDSIPITSKFRSHLTPSAIKRVKML